MPPREIDFGFLFSEVSHFYGMSYQEVMTMPVKAFWLMSGNIRRIRAGEDIRRLMTNAAAQSGEGVKELQNRLVLELGEVFSEKAGIHVERDEAGFNELKMIAATM